MRPVLLRGKNSACDQTALPQLRLDVPSRSLFIQISFPKSSRADEDFAPPTRENMAGQRVDLPVEKLAAAVDTGASKVLVGTAENNLSQSRSGAVPISDSRNAKPPNDLFSEVNLYSDGHLVGSRVTLLREEVAPTVRFLDGALPAVQTVEKAGNRASQDWRLDEAFACVRQGRPARSQETNPRKATRSDCTDWRKKETAGSGPDRAEPFGEQLSRPRVSGGSLPGEHVSKCKGEDKPHKKKSQVRHHE